MKSPCEFCQTRKMYAQSFDIHFCGEDCPYDCDEYNEWKMKKSETGNKQQEKTRQGRFFQKLHKK